MNKESACSCTSGLCLQWCIRLRFSVYGDLQVLSKQWAISRWACSWNASSSILWAM